MSLFIDLEVLEACVTVSALSDELLRLLQMWCDFENTHLTETLVAGIAR